ncbi:hypothetical protein ACS0TY_006811 [Phlomoides rotata]
MEDEQKPDPVLLGLISRREANNGLNQTPSFSMNKGSISHTRSEDQIGQNAKNGSTNMMIPSPVPSFNNWMNKGSISYTRSGNQIPQNSTKNEPWSCSSNPRSLVSASNVWLGMNQEPAKVTFSRKTRAADEEEARLILKGSKIPTRPRSGLKRAASDDEEFHPSKDCNKGKKTEEALFCELCQISCSGAITMQQHLSGRQHKAKMEFRKLKRGGSTNGDRRGKPMCDVCQIWCSDRGALEMHLKGQKHKAKLKEIRNNGGQKGKSTLVLCELCHVHCMNEDLYQMHLTGKQHAWEELKCKEMIRNTN